MKGIFKINDKTLLRKCNDLDFHVHEINHEDGYKGMDYPLAHLVTGTHFVMKGNKIVYAGKLGDVKQFILSR